MMKVEIWSDVMCPFCYIGKREFERALERFPAREQVQVEWKSFELDPDAPHRSPDDTYTMLAKKYGRTKEEARAMTASVVERARSVGLDYDMDHTVLANSFDAHRLIQLAKSKGLGDAAEERLFKAYFMEGAHIADHATLLRLGTEIGLDASEVSRLLEGQAFAGEVRRDESEAQQLGVRGFPFFVIDRKYGVSGAQASDHFLSALEQAWGERPKPLVDLAGADGPACTPEDGCAPA